ncbi:MAG: nucleotidyl transferase AbiEii/AbiGii toxin family protein [Thiotrichaceae bacterium]|nr:nucleotidyl transferase AbiEii/AbiGii toxin family protein [Thiotrichaceae bacterium]
MNKNLDISIRQRLLNYAKAEKVDFNQVLIRFTLERILYRLSQSKHADNFLLKGSLLFALWYDMPHRPTKDADLLGFGASDVETITQKFREVAAIATDDGIIFDPNSIMVSEIREEADYGGMRVVIRGLLNHAVCKVQLDIGFGDAVTPAPNYEPYPVLLKDLPAPQLRTYPIYTVVSEKLHAIVLLGMGNSRMKDYFDLSIIFEHETLDEHLLVEAIHNTFMRRKMNIPTVLPFGLSDEFAEIKQKDWLAFLKKNNLTPRPLSEVVSFLRIKLEPLLNKLLSA